MITTPLAAGQAPPSSEHHWSTHDHLWSRGAWLNLHKIIANTIESICICLVFAFCFTCAFMYTSKNIKTQQQQAQRITFNQSQSISQSINQPNSLPKTWLYYVDILASHWYSSSDLLALPAFLPSAFFHYFIFCQNKGGPGPPGPAPRSTTGHKEEEIWSSLWNKYKTIGLVFGTWTIFKNQRFSFGPKMGWSLAHRQQDHYLIMAYLTGTCYSSSRTYL